MTVEKYLSKDQTVRFLPDRLSRDPVVLRGMTNDEMFIVAGLGIGLGGFLGVVVWLITGDLAIGVSIMALLSIIVFFVASGILQRAKRNRPATWFHRNLQWQIAAKTGLSFGSRVNLRSGVWSARRGHKKAILSNRSES